MLGSPSLLVTPQVEIVCVDWLWRVSFPSADTLTFGSSRAARWCANEFESLRRWPPRYDVDWDLLLKYSLRFE